MSEHFDLRSSLQLLVDRAVLWAEEQSAEIQLSGRPLTTAEKWMANRVGVARPERVRVLLVPTVPVPEDPLLALACASTGMLGPDTIGLTLGHCIHIHSGYERDHKLLAHELRHVSQYERYGSILAFLAEYIPQVLDHGYREAPLEIDARQAADWLHEATGGK